MPDTPNNFTAFWQALEAMLTAVPSTDLVFNQYRDAYPDFDLPEAASIRLTNLHDYLKQATATASVIVVGEAAGPWGCRFSGIPFTGEKQLLDPSFPYSGQRSSLPVPLSTTDMAPPYISKTSTMFWEIMNPFHQQFVMWDIVPFHPHESDEVLSVRNPSTREVAPFGPALVLLNNFVKPKQIVAIGKTAEKEIMALGVACTYVRHPSRGGKVKFARGMREVFGEVGGLEENRSAEEKARSNRPKLERRNPIGFESAWEFLMKMNPKRCRTKTGIGFTFEVKNDSIVYYPGEGTGKGKVQSKERFKAFYHVYFNKHGRSKEDFLNDTGKRSPSGAYSYFIQVFEMLEQQSAK